MIGAYPKLIPVPTHFFKVVRGVRYVPLKGSKQIESSLEQVVLGCFLIPNENIDPTVSLLSILAVRLLIYYGVDPSK